MLDYKEDDHKNIYLIGQEELVSGQDIIFEIEIVKLNQNQEVDAVFKNTKYDNIEIEYLEYVDIKSDIDYRKLENKKNTNIISYKDIDINKKYIYPVVFIINNKDKIVKYNDLLIPDKETYGIIG
jgi:hypothetical protein